MGKVSCRLCGDKFHQLFSHLRDHHKMSVQQYIDTFPGVSLASRELVDYVRSEGLAAVGGRVVKRVEMFRMTLTVDAFPAEATPQKRDYIFDRRLGRQIVDAIRADDRLLLVGPTGCGKSSLVEQIAARLNWSVIRVAASGGLTESDLLGEWTVRDGETVFNYGFLPRAMRMGAICLIDEIDGMEPSVAFSIHQLMEENGQLVLLQNGGEIIEPHPKFRLICTANTLGNGNDSGLYTGTRVLNAAFLDRFTSVLRMDYLGASEELKILRSHVPGCDLVVARALIRVAADVRKAQANDETCCLFSTRRLIDILRKKESLGSLKEAVEVGLSGRLSEEDHAFVREICQRRLDIEI